MTPNYANSPQATLDVPTVAITGGGGLDAYAEPAGLNVIVALRPIVPTLPFKIPNAGSTSGTATCWVMKGTT
jgi:hypothetical protein